MTTQFPVTDAAAEAALLAIATKMPAINPDGGAMIHITNLVQPVNADWNATTGLAQILNKPTISSAAPQVNSDWNATTGITQILNKPTLAAVSVSGAYSDLSGKPTIPAAQVQSDWNASSGVAAILNKPTIPTVPTLAPVATSGLYSDLTGKPTIPAAQVNVDWSSVSGITQILNKPTIPAAQVQSDWNASTGVAAILNKPTISTINQLVLDWVYSNSFAVLTATRNSDEVVTSASIVYPDGGTGTFTVDTLSTLYPGAIDAYHVTYVNGGVTKTITQTAVTRDSSGAVVAQPVLTIA